MAIRFQRHLGSPTSMDPGMFTFVLPDDPREAGTITLACALCDHVSELSDDYDVSPVGVVSPIYSCDRCPFVEWIVLAGIEEDVLR